MTTDGSAVMFVMIPVTDAFDHPDNEIDFISADGTGLTPVIAETGYKRLAD